MNRMAEYRGQGVDPQHFERSPFTQFQTWLGETKGVEGCPVNCTYCFFKLDGLTPIKPKQINTPEEMLKLLPLSSYYQESIPVNFGSQTDVFSTKQNIDYYSKLLELYGSSEYRNPLIFITKRRIPETFIELSKQIPQDVIFYVSYSGLASTGLEPAVNESDQRENFVILHDHNVPVVHYWRPFMPQNSTESQFRKILDHVSKYSTCSVVNGLRLNSGIKDNVARYWQQLNTVDFDFSTLGEVWPRGVRSNLRKIVINEYPEYPVFFGNTPCSVSKSLKSPDRAGLFNGRMCKESNCNQRTVCREHYQPPSNDTVFYEAQQRGISADRIEFRDGMVVIEGEVDTQNIVYLRNKLHYPILSSNVDYISGHNWANVTDDVVVTEVDWSSDEI